MVDTKHGISLNGLEIAVIGMAGRFPGAADIGQFWENLEKGRDCLRSFDDEELTAAGLPADLVGHPDYVKRSGVLPDKDLFDAAFFGYTPAEALAMDPQVRLFHECTWHALEDAGHDPYTFEGLIGVYAGVAPSFNWQLLTLLKGGESTLNHFETALLNERDYLCTRLTYKLNMKGPGVLVDTACSTSLVAIHLACQSLLNGECDMALSGGVKLSHSLAGGYLYRHGMAESPDGCCCAFDDRANGTVGGEGVGVVVLRRLADALKERDFIYAVVKGSAINNDGTDKVGFTAPSVKGQMEVIRAALQMAEVDAATIGYIEAHGTGTPLGDPIEIKALTRAFGGAQTGFCRIGSVKTNIGHLDRAAGVAGFIKAVLTLFHRQIPPSLNFESPNREIDFEHSPFRVNTALREWQPDGTPRRAGVSSFGIGGTNAHIVLEERPPVRQDTGPDGDAVDNMDNEEILVLSARSETALQQMTANLAAFLKLHASVSLKDVAFTLRSGRHPFAYRSALVCRHREEALARLSKGKVQTGFAGKTRPRIIFMFSGQGNQYVNMGLDLYRRLPVFRREMDRGFDILSLQTDLDLKGVLYPPDSESEAAAEKMQQFSYTSPLKFILEYALARQMMHWGFQPDAMIGHSFGEYVAACLAGVFSLEDGLKLSVRRGMLLDQLPEGAMLSVPLSEDDLMSLLAGREDLYLAAVNGPALCIVSGSPGAIRELERVLESRGLEGVRLRVPRPGHSPLMSPMADALRQQLIEVERCEPRLPFISGLTGDWIEAEQAVSPDYWCSHLCRTVRFYDGLREILKDPRAALLQVAPGRGLTMFVEQNPRKMPETVAVDLVRRSSEAVSDVSFILDKVGLLWVHGVQPDWQAFRDGREQCRLPLPVYPFERRRYWFEGDPFQQAAGMLSEKALDRKRREMADWFYIPSWEMSGPVAESDQALSAAGSPCLILADGCGLGERLAERLKAAGRQVVIAVPGDRFSGGEGDRIALNVHGPEDYRLLVKLLMERKSIPGQIIHLLGVTAPVPGEVTGDRVEDDMNDGYYSLLHLVRALAAEKVSESAVEIVVTANRTHLITGEEDTVPARAAVLAACRVIPQEFPYISCRHLEVIYPQASTRLEEKLVEYLAAELSVGMTEPVAAYRGKQRWVQSFKPVRLEPGGERPSFLREKGVYLVTGAPGRHGSIGFILARFLAQQVKARLVLVGRTALPPPEEWDSRLEQYPGDDPLSLKIRRIRELEEMGARVVARGVDVADEKEMKQLVAEAESSFGKINGVIHAAALMGEEAIGSIADDQFFDLNRAQFLPKIHGLLNLYRLFGERELDFCLFTSSQAAMLGGLGLCAYGAANSFLDAFSHRFNREEFRGWVSVDWDNWRRLTDNQPEAADTFMTPQEGVEAFNRILSRGRSPQVIVSTTDWPARLAGPAVEEKVDKAAEDFTVYRKTDMGEWFYRPVWSPADRKGERRGGEEPVQNWLVLAGEADLSDRLVRLLETSGCPPVRVRPADGFAAISDHEYALNPARGEDYRLLFEHLARRGWEPDCIVHLWGVPGNENRGAGCTSLAELDRTQDLGLYSLIELARGLGSCNITREIRLAVVTDGMQSLENNVSPHLATILGPAKIIPLEYPHIKCRSLDIDSGDFSDQSRQVDLLAQDLVWEFREDFTSFAAVAFRGGKRWRQEYAPARLDEPAAGNVLFRERGVYLITGGLGGMGLTVADYLARKWQARLLLVDTAERPAGEEERRLFGRLEAEGAEILVYRADVADHEGMMAAVAEGEKRFGPVNGVIHAAGLVDEAGAMQRRIRPMTDAVLAPKVRGALVLDRLFRDHGLDFLVLFSSLGNILYGTKFGQVGYNAGHEFLGVFADYKRRLGTPAVAVDWTDWREVGMGARLGGHADDPMSISPAEGLAVLERILAADYPRLAVSPVELELARRYFNDRQGSADGTGGKRFDGAVCHPRPDLTTDYVPPGDKVEEKLCTLFRKIFGLERVGIDDDFFELGGDSIKAMTVAAGIHKALDIRVPLAQFFKMPTVRGLAEYIIEDRDVSLYKPIVPVEQRDYYPLTSVQRRLYILQQLDRGGSGYNETVTLELRGRLNPERMQQAFAQTIDRHESLRTAFVLVKGEPMQRVYPRVDFGIENIDAGKMEEMHDTRPKDLNARLSTVISRFIRPFDLSEPPLLRIGLAGMAEDHHLLLLDIHHIITDGTSMQVFVRDFTAFYGAEPLPPLRVQYKEYARWLLEPEQVSVRRQQQAYWLGRFAGETPVLDLPYDYPRPAMQSYKGGDITFDIGPERLNRMKEQVRAENVTLFIWILAVFDILLARLSGQGEIVVGTPTAGRRHADLNNLVGMFVNTLALKNTVEEPKIFTGFLQGVKTTTLEAFENQEYPFEDLVEQVTADRDTGRNPLFDVMFALHNMTLEEKRHREIEIPGLKLSSYDHDYRVAKFDLSLVAAEGDDSLFFILSYCTRLFRPESVERFRDYFVKILNTALDAPGARLSDIEIISAAEKRRILLEFNRGGQDMPVPEDKTFHGLIEDRAKESPDRLAVAFRDGQLSYRALDEGGRRLAAALQGRGAVPDTVVGIMVDRSAEMVTGVLGILKSGAAYMPVDAGYPQDRIRYLLSDSGCKILVTDDSVRLPALTGGLSLIKVEDGSTVESRDSDSLKPAGPPVCPFNLAYVIYTSGSTGTPKGVMVQHDHLVYGTIAWRRGYRLMEMEIRLLQIASLSFDVFAEDLARSLVNGGLLVINPPAVGEPAALYRLIRRQRITLFESTPAFIVPFMEYMYNRQLDPGHLQLLIFGADVCRVGDFRVLLERYGHRMRIVNGYGITEATIDSGFFEGDPDNIPDTGAVPIGKPLPHVRYYILNRQGHLQPPGLAGELYIGGKSVARGYWRQEDLNRDRFLPDPFSPGERMYRSGDAVRWLPDGNVDFLGRLDFQVKIRGYRIELAEIEQRLTSHEGIREAAVKARPDQRGDPYLCAYIVPSTSGPASTAQIRDYLSRFLPGYMVPDFFVFLERLPLTPNGKVDRKALPEPETGAGDETNFIAPEDRLELDLAAVWADILSVPLERIGSRHHFFDLGGNSIKALNMTIALKKKLDIEIFLKDIFDHPRLADLAAAVRQRRDGDYLQEPDFIIFNPQRRLPLFCFPPQVAYGLAYHELARSIDTVAFYSFHFIEDPVPARRYADLIQQARPAGSCVLFGYSAGGMLAFDVARHMTEQGQQVSDIVMLDTICNYTPPGRTEQQEEAEIREILDTIRDMLKDDPRLKEQAYQKMKAYGDYINRLEIRQPLPVNVHLVKSENVDSVLEQYSWRPYTGGEYREYSGSGRHEDMLKADHITHNTRIIRKILGGIRDEESTGGRG